MLLSFFKNSVCANVYLPLLLMNDRPEGEGGGKSLQLAADAIWYPEKKLKYTEDTRAVLTSS